MPPAPGQMPPPAMGMNPPGGFPPPVIRCSISSFKVVFSNFVLECPQCLEFNVLQCLHHNIHLLQCLPQDLLSKGFDRFNVMNGMMRRYFKAAFSLTACSLFSSQQRNTRYLIMTDVKSFVDATLSEHRVVIFSKSYCSYCTKAKRALLQLLDATKIFTLEVWMKKIHYR